MTKEEVAELLSCSTRQVERYTSAGELSVTYEKGTTRKVPVYNRGEVEALKERLDRPTIKPAIARPDESQALMTTGNDKLASQLSELVAIASAKVQQANLDKMADAFSALAEAIEGLKERVNNPSIQIADKVMLTLQDAATLSSLSRNHLLEAIHDGRLKAKIIGRGWRIKRGDLDAYVKKL
jgi:excisionase family DNA binding protein